MLKVMGKSGENRKTKQKQKYLFHISTRLMMITSFFFINNNILISHC